MKKLKLLLIIICFLTKTFINAQKDLELNNLIELGNFEDLKTVYKKKYDTLQQPFITFLRISASNYSKKNMNKIAVNIMKYCYNSYNNSYDCDTISFNNLHLLGIYYSIENEKELSKEANQLCLKKRLSCEIIDPIDIAKSYNNIALYYINENNFDTSLYYIKKAYQINKKRESLKSTFTNTLYSNYLLNLTLLNKINEGLDLLKKWRKIIKSDEEFYLLSQNINNNIYNCFQIKNINGAVKYYNFKKEILKDKYGKKSINLFDFEYNFAIALSNQDYNKLSLKYFNNIEKKSIKVLPIYEQLLIKSSIGTALMNMDFNKEAEEIYEKIKPKILEKYRDSTLSVILLSNISICYKKQKNLIKMKSTRKEFFNVIEKHKYNLKFKEIYVKNIEEDIIFEYQNANYDSLEQKLLESIQYYNKIEDLFRKNLNKLKLSNLYCFYKSNKSQSKNILNEVVKEIPFSNNQHQLQAYYYYYIGEYKRKFGEINQEEFYSKAVDLFDSLKFYPIEYTNSIKITTKYFLNNGNLEKGKILLDKFVKINSNDTNNLEYLDFKIDYLNIISNHQSDDLNDNESVKLLNQIEYTYGIKNKTYQKAARLLENNILDLEYKFNLINKWILSYDSIKCLDYFYSKERLAIFYHEKGDFKLSDSIWSLLINQAKLINKDDYEIITKSYISHLIFSNYKENNFKQAIKYLKELGIEEDEFEIYANSYYFNIYLGIKDYDKAYQYLKKKEKFILDKESEKSEIYYELLNNYSDLFKANNNFTLEKFYREKTLDWLYLNQPLNKTGIVSTTINLVSFLNQEFDLYERSLYLINRAKKHFNINIKNSTVFHDLALLTFESTSNYSLYCLGESKNYQFDSLKLIKTKLESLINQKISAENTLYFKFLIGLIEIELNSINKTNSKLNENISTLRNYLRNYDENNSTFEIENLIIDGKKNEAKKIAIKTNNFNILEELEWDDGNYYKAFNYRFKKEQIEIEKIQSASKCLTDIELEKTRKIQKNLLNYCLKTYLFDNDIIKNEITENIFELVINNHGLLSSLNTDFYKYIRNSDSLFKNDYFYLSKMKNEDKINKNKIKISLEKLQDLEHKVNIKLIERELDTTTKWIYYSDIKKTLNDSTAIVLNYKFVYNGFEGETMEKPKSESYYITFILSSNLTSPLVLIDSLNIHNEQEIVDYYHNEIYKKNYKQNFSIVYQKLWSKIDMQLSNKIKKVIVIPDGVYNLINLYTLFDEKNNKYVFEKYQIDLSNQFSSKIYKNILTTFSKINSAVLLGHPNYSMDIFKNKSKNDSIVLNLNNYYANATRGSIAKNLPGTKKEIEKINTLLTQNGVKTTVFLENNASEENLKKINKPDILHIATHGFFINSKDDFPMFNSGLLLAGSYSKKNYTEDGYLNANETSFLNLENTKLVVLSTCESGRGFIKDGDGVFGLRQGCINAGAQNIIMSLWKVDDKVTQEFMSRFYEIWLNEKTSIREAFKKTQLEIKAKYPQPYYWGAFILVGE